MQGSQAGSVVALWRYPVKSMMGEELNSTEVTQRGLLGDRAYALVDAETGKVASAKNPRRWPRLFDFRAAYTEPPRKGAKLPPVRIPLPDRTVCLAEPHCRDRPRGGAARVQSLPPVRHDDAPAGRPAAGPRHPARRRPAQQRQRRRLRDGRAARPRAPGGCCKGGRIARLSLQTAEAF